MGERRRADAGLRVREIPTSVLSRDESTSNKTRIVHQWECDSTRGSPSCRKMATRVSKVPPGRQIRNGPT